MSDLGSEVFTQRNLGLVSEEEQRRLRDGAVLLIGVGGMGGSAFVTLLRAGVGTIGLTDPDCFEVSNLNRQLLATRSTLGQNKADVARCMASDINPNATIRIYGSDWVERLDEILPHYPVVINGADDAAAAIELYRRARDHRVTVVDAYTSPLPSVAVVRPDDPRPEERLGFPSVGRPVSELTEEDLRGCLLREIEWVATHSSSLAYVDEAVAADVVEGLRPRPSFAPTVLIAGQLMATEALAAMMIRPTQTDYRGWFLDPWTGRIDRPKGAFSRWLRSRRVRSIRERMTQRARPSSDVPDIVRSRVL